MTENKLTTTQERGITITPRMPDFSFSAEEVPANWHSEGAIISAFWNGLSCTTPALEAFFIRDMRRLEPLITDFPELQKELKAFVHQEACHAATHRRWNRLLADWGGPEERVENRTKKALNFIERWTTSRFRSVMVVSGEHFVGELGNVMISRPEVFGTTHEVMRDIWVWHGMEECEHKAVAFDAYTEVYGKGLWSYLTRVAAFFTSSALVTYAMFMSTREFLQTTEGESREWRQLMRYLYGKGGLMSGRAGAFLAILKPSFHPWDYGSNKEVLDKYSNEIFDPAWEEKAARKLNRTDAIAMAQK